jgi:LPS-assembly protein
MKMLPRICLLGCLVLGFSLAGSAQQRPSFLVQSLDPTFRAEFDPATGQVVATHGVSITCGDTVLTARQVSLDEQSGEALAEGDVRLQQGKELWTGDRLQYNFNTRQIVTDQFRAGMVPFYVRGSGLNLDLTNKVYTATNALLTTDDIAQPGYHIRAAHMEIAPGRYIEARDAVLYLGKTPVFYYPHYRKSLDRHPNNFAFTPGYRSLYGAYLLGEYNWVWTTNLDGTIHLDYRTRRGVGTGLDFNYDLGKAGQGNLESYYAHDEDPMVNAPTNTVIKPDRQRISFSHHITIRTNLTARVVVREQSDPTVVRDFYEWEYRKNIQPDSFLEVSQLWPNFSLNALAQPQINDFFETVERLPDLRLSAFPQQLGVSPFFYESESSAGWYRHEFGNSVSNEFSAWRADTYHQLLLPQTLFGWLNVTPRVGGRFTHYGEADGLGTTTKEEDRGVFNTGAEVSAKASRVWQGARSKFWEVNGLRHIVQPSLNYVYVPSPNVLPPQLPQFDSELPSLRLLPITFPEYNAIDAIDSQNVLRLSLRNKLQTKRADGVDNVLNWAIYTDWRLKPRWDQGAFADLYSDMDFKPRSWLTLTSETRYDVDNGHLRIAYHTATIQPNRTWSVSLGHYYVRGNDLFGEGNNLITSRIYYRLSENWGARMSHQFEARDGTMEEQYYTIYRDLRSWTSAVTLRVRNRRNGPTDFTAALTLSLKAHPRFGLGQDSDHPSLLLGG